jgi:hypothetical protein
MAARKLVTGRAVFLALTTVYWAVAFGISIYLGLQERSRIVARMSDPLHFTGAAHRLDHMSRAAGEQGFEAGTVTVIAAGAVYVTLLVLWLIIRTARRK